MGDLKRIDNNTVVFVPAQRILKFKQETQTTKAAFFDAQTNSSGTKALTVDIAVRFVLLTLRTTTLLTRST